MRSDQHSWCKKDRVNRPVQIFYHSGTYAQRKCWLRDVNQLKSEVADHQVSGLGSYRERRSAIETRSWLMSVENFQTCVIHSRNQFLGGFDEVRLCQFFWVPSRGLSCSLVKLNHFSSAFVNETSSNVSEKIVVRKSLAPKNKTKKAVSADKDSDDTPRQNSIQNSTI